MAESSAGLERAKRQLAEASAILGLTSDRRAAAGNPHAPSRAAVQRLCSRLGRHVAAGVPDTRTEDHSHDLIHDRALHTRLQAQRLSLSLLGRGLPVPPDLLQQVGPAAQHKADRSQVGPSSE